MEKRYKDLGNLRRPNSADVNRFIQHPVIYEPISGLKPAVPPKPAAFQSDRIHVRKYAQIFKMVENRLALACRKFLEELPYALSPDDFVLHFFLPFLALDKVWCTRTISSCGTTRPIRMSSSDLAIIA